MSKSLFDSIGQEPGLRLDPIPESAANPNTCIPCDRLCVPDLAPDDGRVYYALRHGRELIAVVCVAAPSQQPRPRVEREL